MAGHGLRQLHSGWAPKSHSSGKKESQTLKK